MAEPFITKNVTGVFLLNLKVPLKWPVTELTLYYGLALLEESSPVNQRSGNQYLTWDVLDQTPNQSWVEMGVYLWEDRGSQVRITSIFMRYILYLKNCSIDLPHREKPSSSLLFLSHVSSYYLHRLPHFWHSWSPNVWRFFPHSKQFSATPLGGLQLSSILKLSIQRPHQVPQVKGSFPQDCPHLHIYTLQRPVTSLLVTCAPDQLAVDGRF